MRAFQALRSIEKLVNEFFVGDHVALGGQLAESLLLRLVEEVANGVEDLFELFALDGSVIMTIEFLKVGEQLGLGIAFADSGDDGGLEFLQGGRVFEGPGVERCLYLPRVERVHHWSLAAWQRPSLAH